MTIESKGSEPLFLITVKPVTSANNCASDGYCVYVFTKHFRVGFSFLNEIDPPVTASFFNSDGEVESFITDTKEVLKVYEENRASCENIIKSKLAEYGLECTKL